MSLKRVRSHALAGLCGGAALVLATACGPNNAEPPEAANPNTETPMASNEAAQNSPITVTGCLQRGANDDFILTAMNEPSTSGAPAAGDKVDREQLTEAKHAYKLTDADEDQLKSMVGNSVKVVGTIARQSDVARASQKPSDELAQSDLAQIDVARVQRVAESCGK
jgi:hypothetical protein